MSRPQRRVLLWSRSVFAAVVGLLVRFCPCVFPYTLPVPFPNAEWCRKKWLKFIYFEKQGIRTRSFLEVFCFTNVAGMCRFIRLFHQLLLHYWLSCKSVKQFNTTSLCLCVSEGNKFMSFEIAARVPFLRELKCLMLALVEQLSKIKLIMVISISLFSDTKA